MKIRPKLVSLVWIWHYNLWIHLSVFKNGLEKKGSRHFCVIFFEGMQDGYKSKRLHQFLYILSLPSACGWVKLLRTEISIIFSPFCLFSPKMVLIFLFSYLWGLYAFWHFFFSVWSNFCDAFLWRIFVMNFLMNLMNFFDEFLDNFLMNFLDEIFGEIFAEFFDEFLDEFLDEFFWRDESFWQIFVTNSFDKFFWQIFDEFFWRFLLTFNLLTIASSRIWVPSILFFYKSKGKNKVKAVWHPSGNRHFKMIFLWKL